MLKRIDVIKMRVYIPEVIGYDLNIFTEQLFNIHILQNMLIEFRKDNEV